MRRTFHIPLSIVELEPDNYHLICRGRINGHPLRLIIDTGASHSCFDTHFITSIQQDAEMTENDGLSVSIGSDDFASHITILKQFKLGQFELTDYQVVLLDLIHVNQAYLTLKLPTIQGIIGSDFLRRYGAVIDYQTLTMTIRIPKEIQNSKNREQKTENKFRIQKNKVQTHGRASLLQQLNN